MVAIRGYKIPWLKPHFPFLGLTISISFLLCFFFSSFVHRWCSLKPWRVCRIGSISALKFGLENWSHCWSINQNIIVNGYCFWLLCFAYINPKTKDPIRYQSWLCRMYLICTSNDSVNCFEYAVMPWSYKGFDSCWHNQTTQREWRREEKKNWEREKKKRTSSVDHIIFIGWLNVARARFSACVNWTKWILHRFSHIYRCVQSIYKVNEKLFRSVSFTLVLPFSTRQTITTIKVDQLNTELYYDAKSMFLLWWLKCESDVY